MNDKALQYLLDREWSMGNGQCPDCYGVPPSWHGHPLHMRPETIGHEISCRLAEAIETTGGSVIFQGKFYSDVEYEHCIKEIGELGTQVFGTQIKGTDPDSANRYKAWLEELDRLLPDEPDV